MAVRVRPASSRERSSDPLVRVVDEHVLAFDANDTSSGVSQRGGGQQGKRKKDMMFAFDAVFDQQATQLQVYQRTLLPMLDYVLDGVNVSVFAYGVRVLVHSHQQQTPTTTNNNLCLLCSVLLFMTGHGCGKDPHDAGVSERPWRDDLDSGGSVQAD